jgi:cytochrome c oxidase assembly factor CtaG
MPLSLILIIVTGFVYVRGAREVWRAAGPGRGIRRWQVNAYLAGLAAVAIALISPLDGMAQQLFSAHMVQHLLLVSIAAPLLALGAPQVGLLWGLPRASRVIAGRIVQRLHHTRGLAALPIAFVLHSLTLWLWHAPPFFESALHNSALHISEHILLLGTGFLFWSATFNGLIRGGPTLGASVLYVFAFAAQCTGLGALITLSTHAWYSAYSSTTAFGLSAMDDQALAGALMWVPAGMLYLGFALLLLGFWLHPSSATEPARWSRMREHPSEGTAHHQTRLVD